uniref:RNA methyltransferase n=1 Tax=Rhizophora mucronata TaxID=61149 RepID=A0A2P2K2S3_RHIMU
MVEFEKEEKKKNKKKEKKKRKVAEKTKPEITAEEEEDNGDKEKKSLKMDKSQIKTAQRQQENISNNKKKRKGVFPYGNYRNYYGYRIGKEMEEDPRLRVLKREWFQGKDCLDIGCNSGIITLHIAKKFHCHSICGIDIDNGESIYSCGTSLLQLQYKLAYFAL